MTSNSLINCTISNNDKFRPPLPVKPRILTTKSKVKFSPTPASTSAPSTLLRLSPMKLLSMESSWPLTLHNTVKTSF